MTGMALLQSNYPVSNGPMALTGYGPVSVLACPGPVPVRVPVPARAPPRTALPAP